MKCAHCGREVALAKYCPYCGKLVPHDDSEEAGAKQQRKAGGRGVFRGPLGRAESRDEERAFGIIPEAIRYFRDPAVAGWRKSVILAGLIYVLSPVDLVPGALLPLLGWLDDAVVATFAWRLLAGELERYRRSR